MYDLIKSAANVIPFVLVDSNGDAVTGLGSGFTVTLSKNGGAFGASAGSKAELSNGWYKYTTTTGECDTDGPLALRITGAGAVTQNLVYMVGAPGVSAAVWVNNNRSLSMTWVQVQQVMRDRSRFAVHRGDNIEIQFTGLGTIDPTDDLYFTMKENTTVPDSKSIIQIDRDTGLICLNGVATGLTALDGTFTVDDAVAGDITITLKSALTELLNPVTNFVWDVMLKTSAGERYTKRVGSGQIDADVTRT